MKGRSNIETPSPRDTYKPLRNQKSQKSVLVPVIATAFITFVFAFGLGFRAEEAGLLASEQPVSANEGLPEDLNYDSVEEVYDELRAKFDGELSQQELLDGLKRGLVDASGDEYTVYLDEAATTSFYEGLNGSFEGIGAELGTENDLVIVVAPIDGFPAAEAGLRPQDAIISIDGEDSIGIPVEEAVTRIRGEAGTDVTLGIVRGTERLEITITRATITIASVESEIREDNVGYLKISRFAEDTAALSRKAANEFKAAGVNSVVLDLRSNSGGFVDAAVEVASLWLNNEVVYEQRSDGVVENRSTALGRPVLNGIETIVLINEGSASASEIVAGSLKDNAVAQLLGKTSFGKGSVQQIAEFDDGSTLKVTIARWFTPNGINISESGIDPDIEVEITEEDFENDRDPQLDRALELVR